MVMALIGVLILSYEVMTRGEHGAWMLWIAIPLLMISLGYFYVINAFPVFLDASADKPSDEEQLEGSEADAPEEAAPVEGSDE